MTLKHGDVLAVDETAELVGGCGLYMMKLFDSQCRRLVVILLAAYLIYAVKSPPLLADTTQMKPPTNAAEAAATNRSYLPNILLIGAQKGGSSAVADWFYERGGVCAGQTFPEKYNEASWYRKEMHFFSNRNRWSMGKEFYMEHYKHCYDKNKTYIMDATPNYLLKPSAERAYETYKDDPVAMAQLKIILTVREPLSRELSYYNHMVDNYSKYPNTTSWEASIAFKTNGTSQIKTFSQYADSDFLRQPEPYSHYAIHLSDWFRYFDPRQILVLSYQHDIQPGSPAKSKLLRFLDAQLHPFKAPTGPFLETNTHNNPAKVKTMPCSDLDRLWSLMESWNQELYELLASHERPPMEQNPFPKFERPACDPSK
jgi:Sulfotransferase domain